MSSISPRRSLQRSRFVTAAEIGEILSEMHSPYVQTVRTSRDDCTLLRSRILQLLPVIIMAAKKALDKQDYIPQDLTDNIERFQK